jgi:hypothetical protein
MHVPEPVALTIGDERFELNEDNCWVCLFTDAPEYNHIYIYSPSTFVVFNNPNVMQMLIELGYPLQTRRLPRPWDINAYDLYINMLTEELDRDLEGLDEEVPPTVD